MNVNGGSDEIRYLALLGNNTCLFKECLAEMHRKENGGGEGRGVLYPVIPGPS